ncbi:hypothetical protein [Dyadobacter sp. CY312]|uniref:hypothetical protein n=1 Tax=Dyadobacter sp. CY312 TaxID=2907303 RepID=UPI001F330A5A|nr:hypothetical protein [Dyadobacter sp. CY312]MCE7044246.1 hypothetical protein [Dyadobacter sp. CY312]
MINSQIKVSEQTVADLRNISLRVKTPDCIYGYESLPDIRQASAFPFGMSQLAICHPRTHCKIPYIIQCTRHVERIFSLQTQPQ